MSHPCPTPAVPTRARRRRRSARSTTDRSRWAGACASRGPSCRSPSRCSCWSSRRACSLKIDARPGRGGHRPVEQAAAAGGVPRLLRRVSVARLPLGEDPARDRACGIGAKDSTEILYLSWLVNCLVPAKLGDVYRAYLLKINSPVSLSRTFGTVFIERILDLFAIAILGLAAGFWSFRDGPAAARSSSWRRSAWRTVVVLAVAAAHAAQLRAPDHHPPARCRTGSWSCTTSSRRACSVPSRGRQLPGLVVLTVLIWCTEGLRLWLVVQALGFPDAKLGHLRRVLRGPDRVAAHRRPAEPGRPGHRRGRHGRASSYAAYGMPATEAATIVLVDRVISVFSIILHRLDRVRRLGQAPRGRRLSQPIRRRHPPADRPVPGPGVDRPAAGAGGGPGPL